MRISVFMREKSHFNHMYMIGVCDLHIRIEIFLFFSVTPFNKPPLQHAVELRGLYTLEIQVNAMCARNQS